MRGPRLTPALHAAAATVFLMVFMLGSLVVLFGTTGLNGPAAYACDQLDPTCQPTIGVTATTTVGGNPGTPGENHCYRQSGAEVPCTSASGSWYAPYDCYISPVPVDQWPAADDPVYNGVDATTGQVYWCAEDWTGANRMVFIGGAQPVDPRQVVEEAAKTMPLELAQPQVAPGPDWHTYIHLDNWLWIPPEQWHPVTTSVTAGAITVTAIAAPLRIDWDLDTDTVRCADPGRPWVAGMTDAAKTTCSYAYDTLDNPTGDLHPVSAHIVYDITWTCAGPCLIQAGSLGEWNAAAGPVTTIEVRQRQTVVTQ